MIAIKTDAEVEHAWAAALSDKQVEDPTRTSPSEIEFESYSSNVDAILTIARRESKDLIAEEADRVYADRT